MWERGLYMPFLLIVRWDRLLHRHVSEKITVELVQEVILLSCYQREVLTRWTSTMAILVRRHSSEDHLVHALFAQL